MKGSTLSKSVGTYIKYIYITPSVQMEIRKTEIRIFTRRDIKFCIVMYYLSDSDTKNGGIRDLSGSKEMRECKAI